MSADGDHEAGGSAGGARLSSQHDRKTPTVLATVEAERYLIQPVAQQPTLSAYSRGESSASNPHP